MEDKDILKLFYEDVNQFDTSQSSINQAIKSTSEINMEAIQQVVDFKLPKITNEN